MTRLCAITLVWLSAWTTAEAADPVRIVHQALFPPFAEIKDGKSVGLAVDLFRAAAERGGIKTEFLPLPLDQLEAALKDGRAQAVVATAVTPERRERLDFSAPILTTGGAFYVRAPEPTPPSFQALAGKVVVTPRSGPLAAFIRSTAPAVKLVVTTSYEESLARLIARDADAAALNYQAGAQIAARLYPGKITVPRGMFLEVPLGAAVLKGTNADFLTKLNTGLAAIRADGTWDRINKGWMGQ
jgi:polar amino acid transport system substrate-binding protein